VAIKTAFMKQVQGVTVVARGASNHWVIMDGSPDINGSGAASTPKELVLMALAGCTANDVIPILKKKRVPLQNLEIKVSGVEQNEHPKIFTEIHVEYIFYGEGIKAPDVERAIELSTTKYCSVSAILSASAKLTHSYRIEVPTTAGATVA
jgi:Predicted redox protein, regulator of disulfide bond formation